MLKTWRNGEKAGVIQKIIESNFKILGRHLSQNMLCLSTTEREVLGSDYLSRGLKVYDTTLDKWFVYNGVGWDKVKESYTLEFSSDDWSLFDVGLDGWTDYYIAIPFTTHLIENPTIQIFIKDGVGGDGNNYSPVIGGYRISEGYKVVLWSDMPYEGKVVMK